MGSWSKYGSRGHGSVRRRVEMRSDLSYFESLLLDKGAGTQEEKVESECPSSRKDGSSDPLKCHHRPRKSEKNKPREACSACGTRLRTVNAGNEKFYVPVRDYRVEWESQAGTQRQDGFKAYFYALTWAMRQEGVEVKCRVFRVYSEQKEILVQESPKDRNYCITHDLLGGM